jgi:DNA-binding NarL/FixJ family response regulator
MKTTATTTKERILIVEDEQSILLAISDYLTNLGYEVDGVSEMHAAQTLLAQKRYTAVISDLRLTGTDANEGLALAELVHRQFPGTEMILLSAYGSAAVEQRARAHGVNVFLHKPKPLAELAQIIYSVVAEKELDTGGSVPSATAAAGRTVPMDTRPVLARFRLSADELQVARLVGEGRGNADIARELGMPESQVRAHRDALAIRLDPRSRFELALYLVREGGNS